MKKIIISSILFSIGLLPFTVCGQITGSWSPASSIGLTPRLQAGSAVVNGKIYVIGGIRNSDLVTTMQVFDPVANSWSTPATSGTFTPRYGLSCSVVGGKIYALGGYNDSTLNTLEVFDPATNTWTTPVTTGKFTPRAHLTSNVVNGKIYVIGGVQFVNQAPVTLGLVEVFDTATNTWTTVTPSSGSFNPVTMHNSEVIDGKIYVIGNSSMQVYDPAANSLTNLSSGNIWGYDAASAVIGKNIFVLGGFAGQVTNLVHIYDIVQDQWYTPETTGTFTAREGLVTGVIGKSIYAIGGVSDVGVLSTNEVLNITLDAVSANKTLPEISLSPNPSQGIVSIGNIPNGTKLNIVNTLGETIFEVQNLNAENIAIDLSKFPAGVYYARSVSAGAVVVKKIMRK